MQRRNFIKGIAGAMVITSIPVAVSASDDSVDWQQVDNVNTFNPDDTIHQRLEKLRKLMGTNITLGYIGVHGEYVRTDKFYGENNGGRRCLIFSDGHGTGYMDKETMLHWTAQVALGYRIATARAN